MNGVELISTFFKTAHALLSYQISGFKFNPRIS